MILEGNIDGFLKGSIETVGKVPVINELNVVENGIYTPPSGVDGFAPINVNIPNPELITLNVTENGTYTPPSGVDGFDGVIVNVPPQVIIDWIVENEKIYSSSERTYYFKNQLESSLYLLSFTWYDYNRTRIRNELIQFDATTNYRIDFPRSSYNYGFNCVIDKDKIYTTLTSGSAFDLYLKMTKVNTDTIYT